MKTEITIKLIVDGDRDALDTVLENVLDSGVLQDAINDYGQENGPFKVLSCGVSDLRPKKRVPAQDVRSGPGVSPTFPDWMCAKLGSWIISRRCPRLSAAGYTTFLSAQRYRKLWDEWAQETDWTRAALTHLEHEAFALPKGVGRDAARRELARRWLGLCPARECLNPGHASDGRCTFHRGEG